MTTERLDGSGIVCRHCKAELYFVGGFWQAAQIPKKGGRYCKVRDGRHEPAPAEQPRREPVYYLGRYVPMGESVAASPCPICGSSKPHIVCENRASPAEGPRWVKQLYESLGPWLHHRIGCPNPLIDELGCNCGLHDKLREVAAQPSLDAAKVEDVITKILVLLTRSDVVDLAEELRVILRPYFPQVSPDPGEEFKLKQGFESEVMPTDRETRSSNGFSATSASSITPGLAREATEGRRMPDFTTLNGSIEALEDAAAMLREKEGSTGFDVSVALIIERAVQSLKSVDPAPAPEGAVPPDNVTEKSPFAD